MSQGLRRAASMRPSMLLLVSRHRQRSTGRSATEVAALGGSSSHADAGGAYIAQPTSSNDATATVRWLMGDLLRQARRRRQPTGGAASLPQPPGNHALDG